MLRVASVRDTTGRYYLADLGAELAVPSPHRAGPSAREACGWWAGRAAAAFGLDGPVAADQLGAVLSGRHPRTDGRLRTHPVDVAAYDLIFAAPKSASIAWALGDAHTAAEVLSAHREAVAGALCYVEDHALSVRRRANAERHVVKAGGMLAARFTHGLSRAGDPHLHTHVLVANIAHGEDGRWSAVDGRALYAHSRAAGALYDAHLRHAVQRLAGFEWSVARSGAIEITGVDPVLMGTLSGRQADIRAHAADHSRPRIGTTLLASPRARSVAWAATRDAKPSEVTVGSLRRIWRARARDAGVVGDLVPAHAMARAAREPGTSGKTRLDEHRFNSSLWEMSAKGVTRRDVVAAWSAAVLPGAPVPVVESCVEALARWTSAVGVAEMPRSLRDVVSAPHHLRALGARPATPDSLALWRTAAAAIDRYREHWSVCNEREPLGTGGAAAELSAMPVRRLAEYLTVRRQVADTLHRLGRDLERDTRAIPALERAL